MTSWLYACLCCKIHISPVFLSVFNLFIFKFSVQLPHLFFFSVSCRLTFHINPNPTTSCKAKNLSHKSNNKNKVAGLESMHYMSKIVPAILAHVGAAVQSAKGLSQVEYELEGVVINKFTLGQSHHWSHHSETAVPITVMRDNRSTNGTRLLQEIISLIISNLKSAACGRWCGFLLTCRLLVEISNKNVD